MFNISALLNSIDNSVKETLSEPKESATKIRENRKKESKKNLLDGEVSASATVSATPGQYSNSNHSSTHSFPSSDGVPDGGDINNSGPGESRKEFRPEKSLDGGEVSVSSASPSSSDLQAETDESHSVGGSKYNRAVSPDSTNIIDNDAGSGSGGSGGSNNNRSDEYNISKYSCDNDNNSSNETVQDYMDKVENLNRECLELEDSNNNLKREIAEVWALYKISQEKAANKEMEMQEEFQLLQSAKLAEKNNMNSQYAKLNETIELLKSERASNDREKQEYRNKIETLNEDVMQWQQRYDDMSITVDNTRSDSFQEVDQLRKDLKASQDVIHNVRFEHSNVIRTFETRQLENENQISQLTQQITDKQREINKLTAQQSEKNGGVGSISGLTTVSQYELELDKLQRKYVQAVDQADVDKERHKETERSLRTIENENRGLKLLLNEERLERDKLNERIASQESLLKSKNAGNIDIVKNSSSEDVEKLNKDTKYYTNEIESLKIQLQDLSRQLLRKSSSVAELQAERSALKSRVSDLQARCTQTEQQLSNLRDLEGGIETMDSSETSSSSSSSSSFGSSSSSSFSGRLSAADGLKKRNGLFSGPISGRAGPQVISDLEKMGVRPAASVAQAVNWIDSYALLTGRLLRSHSLLRFGFVLYLIILHIWVFVVIAFHTHSLEDFDASNSTKPKLLPGMQSNINKMD